MTPTPHTFCRTTVHRVVRTVGAHTVAVATLLGLAPVDAQAHSLPSAPPHLFDYERRPLVIVRDSVGDTIDGVRESLILLSSGGHDTIVARLFTQTEFTERRPALIMGHGASGSGAKAGPRARCFARRGAVVLVVDAPFVSEVECSRAGDGRCRLCGTLS